MDMPLRLARRDIRVSGAASQRNQHRFERVAVTSAFGDPAKARTWSGAPFNLGMALAQLGLSVDFINPGFSRVDKAAVAMSGLICGHGLPRSGEMILRAPMARRQPPPPVQPR